jgi:hypothetical protein
MRSFRSASNTGGGVTSVTPISQLSWIRTLVDVVDMCTQKIVVTDVLVVITL